MQSPMGNFINYAITAWMLIATILAIAIPFPHWIVAICGFMLGTSVMIDIERYARRASQGDGK